MQCVILAGGLGTRMRAFTEKIPKSLIPIGTGPFLHYQLHWMANQGVSNVVICLGYRGNLIRDYAGEGTRWGLQIRYVDEGDQLRGTAGALRLALDSGVLEPTFLVTYGDSFLPVDFPEIWEVFESSGDDALMTVLKNADQWDRSNACFNGRKVTLYDKNLRQKPENMAYIDYGLMAFLKSTIEREVSPHQVADLANLLHALSIRGRLAGLEMKERFFEIGSPQGLADFKQYAKDKKLAIERSFMAFPKLNIAVFADGAQREAMLKRYHEGFVKGFTTNPTLMAKAGIRDYEQFAHSILSEIKDLPISFEVFSDEFDEMEKQASLINSWGPNVNIKIPITNTRSQSSIPLIRRLLDKGLKLNVTAILAPAQIEDLRRNLQPKDDVIVSIFAGRVADAGVDPIPMMKKAVADYRSLPKAKILWASPREVLNIYQAEECGCHIITATDDLIGKLVLHGKDLTEFSLDTVKMFYEDAKKAGFSLRPPIKA
jgi:transaldolase